MYAIIRQHKGHYYTTSVFGKYYDNYSEASRFDREYNKAKFLYFIVFDEKRETLVKQYLYDGLQRLVLITDNDKSDWNYDNESGTGEVSFSNYDELNNLVENAVSVPERFHVYDNEHIFSDIIEVKTEQDCENLLVTFLHFHDAHIESIKRDEDKLTVLFESMWGCDLEITFEDDITYDVERRNPDYYDPYWDAASIKIQKGYIWLMEGENTEPEECEEVCWFRARHMKYRVIPS